MKLSTKTRYGLRALLELVRQYDGRTPLSITDIASKENISERYLEQLFLKLRRDGLIESVRGPQGGYLLSRAPMEITVAEVVEVHMVFPLPQLVFSCDIQQDPQAMQNWTGHLRVHQLALYQMDAS